MPDIEPSLNSDISLLLSFHRQCGVLPTGSAQTKVLFSLIASTEITIKRCCWLQMRGESTKVPFMLKLLCKGSLTTPKRMNFRKSSKRRLTPNPPHFRKVILQFFSEIHDRSIVYKYNGKNLQYKFLDWKWPPLPPPLELFRKFIRFGRERRPLDFDTFPLRFLYIYP